MNFNNIFYLPNNAQNTPAYKKVELFYILFMLRLQSQAWFTCAVSASQLRPAPFQELHSHVARGPLTRPAKHVVPYAPALKIPLESLFKVLY